MYAAGGVGVGGGGAPNPPRPPKDDEETEFEAVDFVDSVPDEFNLGDSASGPTDEDFFDMIRDDLSDPRSKDRKKPS